MKKGLPEGWIEVNLDDCCDILDNLRKPVSATERAKRIGDIPYYGATGQAGTIDDYIFDEELVLIGEDGAPFFDEKKNVAYIINGKSWVNNHAHVLKGKQNILANKILLHYLNQFDYTGFVGGTTRLKLTQGNLKKINVTLLPFAEQQRIAAKLDSLFARIEKMKGSLERIPQLLKDFRQAVLTQAVTGKLTEEWRGGRELEEWQKLISSEIFSFVTSGSRGWAKYYSKKGEQLFVRITNMDYGTFKLNLARTKLQFLDLPDSSEGRRTLLQPKDILISITADVGMISLIPDDFKYEAYVNQHICLARPKADFNEKYIALYLMSESGLGQFEEKKRGVTKVGLTLGDIKSLMIPIPSFEEQQEIVRRVESLFVKADKIKAQYQIIKEKIEQLPQAILAKAFRGELVEQLPSDGDARELLEQIKQARAELEKKPKTTAKRGKTRKLAQERAEKRVAEPKVEYKKS